MYVCMYVCMLRVYGNPFDFIHEYKNAFHEYKTKALYINKRQTNRKRKMKRSLSVSTLYYIYFFYLFTTFINCFLLIPFLFSIYLYIHLLFLHTIFVGRWIVFILLSFNFSSSFFLFFFSFVIRI